MARFDAAYPDFNALVEAHIDTVRSRCEQALRRAMVREWRARLKAARKRIPKIGTKRMRDAAVLKQVGLYPDEVFIDECADSLAFIMSAADVEHHADRGADQQTLLYRAVRILGLPASVVFDAISGARDQVKGTRRYQAAQRASDRLEPARTLIDRHSAPLAPLNLGALGKRRRPRPLSGFADTADTPDTIGSDSPE